MKTARNIVRRRIACALALVVSLALVGQTAQAVPVPVDGSITLGAHGATQDAATLDLSTEFHPYAITGWTTVPIFTDDRLTMFDGSDDFAGLPFTLITTTALLPADFTSFAFTSDEGDWVTTSGSIITSSSDFLDILLIGEFTPKGTLADAGLAPAAGELRIQMNQSGTSVGWTSTMVMTGPIIPEPMTMSILGLGGVVLLKRRRRN